MAVTDELIDTDGDALPLPELVHVAEAEPEDVGEVDVVGVMVGVDVLETVGVTEVVVDTEAEKLREGDLVTEMARVEEGDLVGEAEAPEGEMETEEVCVAETVVVVVPLDDWENAKTGTGAHNTVTRRRRVRKARDDGPDRCAMIMSDPSNGGLLGTRRRARPGRPLQNIQYNATIVLAATMLQPESSSSFVMR